MLKNYFKIAWRNLWKNKALSAINIGGLSVGLTFAMLISGYVWGELQVNQQLKNSGNQYILQSKWKDPNMGFELTTLGPLAKVLKEQYPNLVANYFRWDGVTSNISQGDKAFRENLQIGDSTMLSMYGFNLIHGNEKTTLNAPFTVVISAQVALKYFGKTNVLGETLSIESFSGTKHDFMITGILENPGRNSVTFLNADNNNQIYIPESSAKFFGRNLNRWNNIHIVGFIELRKGVTPADLEKPLQQLVRQNTPDHINENLSAQLVPLTEYYLNADKGLVRKMLYTLSAIAFFILVLAVINFINITVSRSSIRMKEIGVRKVMGGVRRQLILQFLSESILLVFISTLISLVLYQVFRPYFIDLLGKNIPAFSDYPLQYLLLPFFIVLTVGFLAGVYPAFVLSSLKCVNSLKGILRTTNESVLLRKVLIGFQFCVALIVFIGALVVTNQVKLFLNKDLGYDKELIISAQVPRDWTEKGVARMETIRNEFSRMPEIQNAALSYQIPNGNYAGMVSVFRTSTDSTQSVSAIMLAADANYAATYSIPIIAGTFLSDEDNENNLSKIVVNETHAKALGWKNPHEALGKKVRLTDNPTVFTIAGVTRDFHFESKQRAIQPFIFLNLKKVISYRFLTFKIQSGNIVENIAAIQAKWSKLLPGSAFEFTFMDDTLKTMYTTEIQLKKASYTAAVLTIIIVLIGVLSLVSLSLQNRTKEIGIRKVLGASVPSIVSLFIKEFSGVILLAGIVACPVAYMVMHAWLNEYVYRITLTGQPFLIALLGLASLTVLLIILQTIKTALTSPVKSLRTE